MNRLSPIAGLCLGVISCSSGQIERQPAVAGSFYPADSKELTVMVDGFLAKAKPPEIKNVVALVAPHAGYPYSGPVAAYSYALLKGRKVRRVVVIAPSHYEAFDFASVYDGDAYKTPLGSIRIDRAFATQLAKANTPIRLSSRGHLVTGQNREHALEVQLPFLQRVIGSFDLVPIVMGSQDLKSSRALGLKLAEVVGASDTLIVASSDLSHYHPYEDAVKLDRMVLKAIESRDYVNLSANVERNTWEACGGGPIVAAMIAAERLGASKATLLKYANSGDTAGDKRQVVGYGAVAIYKESASQPPPPDEFSLTAGEKQELLRLARRSVESAVRDRKAYEYKPPASGPLTEKRGAFVTLMSHGELRGCIGQSSAVEPLWLAVRDVAAYAALRDTRFVPVSPRELSELEYEISVLSPLRKIKSVDEIVVGKHGLIMQRGDYQGLLLPQVASERNWDRKTFLEQTCSKAGLPLNAWHDPATAIFVFTALVFGDHPTPPMPAAGSPK